ncbi:MAG: hypothetical protein JNJ42_02165 [Burkholderiaceae bacterium]|nr:hypothetical protein [Burkholderiaceae bacterium]
MHVMSTCHTPSLAEHACPWRHKRLLALCVAAVLDAGVVHAEGTKEAPASLNLSLPRDAVVGASGPTGSKSDARDAGRPYGSGYEARGLGVDRAEAASAPAGAASSERPAPSWRMNTPAPGAGTQRAAHGGGRPARGGRR